MRRNEIAAATTAIAMEEWRFGREAVRLRVLTLHPCSPERIAWGDLVAERRGKLLLELPGILADAAKRQADRKRGQGGLFG